MSKDDFCLSSSLTRAWFHHSSLHNFRDGILQKGHSVIIDNTNPTVEARESLIRLDRMYDAEISGYYFESQVRWCLERNRLREGKAHVPDVAIYVTARKLVRPSYKEGFDKLFSVRITGDSFFEIQEWKEGQDER